MHDSLLDLVRRYADARADAYGVATTPITGLSTIRALAPGELQYAISRPLLALVVQGTKRVSMGEQGFTFGAGDSMVIAADVPTVSQVTRASAGQPYYSLVLELDPLVIESLLAELGAQPTPPTAPILGGSTEQELADAAGRLLRLLNRPDAVPLLGAALVRELHYWLLAGRHGAAVRALGMPESHGRRIGRAVALIRRALDQPLRVERLAEAAAMSPASFYQHFRALTTLSPLQFQKRLRLIEARRRLVAEGQSIGVAAQAVGYESVPQFTREYGRLFGISPGRDRRSLRDGAREPELAA